MTAVQPISFEQSEREIQQQTKLSTKLSSSVHPNDDAKDYDPTDSVEQAQAAKDQLDDKAYDDCKAVDVAEEIAVPQEIDEVELVNSESFAEQLESAIVHVQAIAKTHREEMIRAAKEQYERDTGRAPSQEMIDEAMAAMKESVVAADDVTMKDVEIEAQPIETVSVEAEPEVGAVTAAEMESALEHVRSLGRRHRSQLEKRFSDLFSDVNGVEPTDEDMSGIFARVRELFAEETRDEFLDIHDQDELEGDSDYEPSADQFTFEYFKDIEDDVADSEEDIRRELSDLRDDSLLSESEDDEWVEVSLDETESTFDEAHFASEMDFALKHVRDLASVHQGEFVNSICDILTKANGSEPSLEELSAVFSEIPRAFAHEANHHSIAYEINFNADEDEDADYDPSDDSQDYAQDQIDQEVFDKIEQTDDQSEMEFALEHVQNLARLHQNAFVNQICDIFAAENGKEASTAELYEMFGAIKQGFADEAAEEAEESVSACDDESEDESDAESDAESEASVSVSVPESEADSCDFDEELFDEEMEVALKHVRDLGAIHQNTFVNTICELYVEDFGAEPSTQRLYDLFRGIQQLFAEEADEEGSAFVVSVSDSAEDTESEEEESEDMSEQDSYDPDTDSFDYAVDADDDIDFEREVEDASETESESVDESEAESESESDYSFDNAVDATNSIAFATSASESATESEAESESVSESYAVSEVNSLEDEDGTEFESEEETESEDFSERDSYNPSEDSFDYAVDREDSIAFAPSTSESELSVDARYETESEDESRSEAESANDSSEKESYDPEDDSFNYKRDTTSAESSDSESESASSVVSEIDSVASFSRSLIESIDESASKSVELSESVLTMQSLEFDDELRNELNSALSHVRELAKLHQSEFVNEICDIIYSQTGAGQGPTTHTAKLCDVFRSIKQSFAQEAIKESESEYESAEAESAESEYEQESAGEADSESEQELSVDAQSEYESEEESRSEAESANDISEKESYDPEDDSFDYQRDATSAESSESESESASSAVSDIDSIDESASKSVSESLDFDVELRNELNSALSHVRELAKLHQSEFVNQICDIIYSQTESGQDPTTFTAELCDVFASIKQSFAQEAIKESESEYESVEAEFAESEYESVRESDSESEQESEEDMSEQDSYDPDTDSFDYAIDAEDDIDFEREVEAASEIESESVDESEAQSENYSERDSYSPSDDSVDYAVDADDSIAFATSESESAAESECESSVTESEAESEAESVADSVAHSEDAMFGRVQSLVQQSMKGRARELFAEEFGEEPTEQHLRDIFDFWWSKFAEKAEEDEACDLSRDNDSLDYAEDESESESARSTQCESSAVEKEAESASESELSVASRSESRYSVEKESDFEYDSSERDSYDPKEDSFAYTMSIGDSVSQSKASIDSYNPSTDGFEYAVHAESTTENESDEASSDESSQ